MESERYRILALRSSGGISQEDAERRLASLGRRQLLFTRVLWFAAVALIFVVLVNVFHQGEKLRWVVATGLQTLDGMEVFRQIHVFLSRLLESL